MNLFYNIIILLKIFFSFSLFFTWIYYSSYLIYYYTFHFLSKQFWKKFKKKKISKNYYFFFWKIIEPKLWTNYCESYFVSSRIANISPFFVCNRRLVWQRKSTNWKLVPVVISSLTDSGIRMWNELSTRIPTGRPWWFQEVEGDFTSPNERWTWGPLVKSFLFSFHDIRICLGSYIDIYKCASSHIAIPKRFLFFLRVNFKLKFQIIFLTSMFTFANVYFSMSIHLITLRWELWKKK